MSRFAARVTNAALALAVQVCMATHAWAAGSPGSNHDAHQAHPHHEVTWFGMAEKPGDPVGIAYLLLNFAVLLFILNKLVFRPLRLRNEERSDRIRTELEKATAARQAAEDLMNACRVRMDGLDREVAAITEEARQQASRARAELLAQANADAQRIRQGALDFAEREAARVKRQVEAEVIERAVAKAEALIRANFNPNDQARLVEACVSDIRQMNLNDPRRSYHQ